MNDKFNASAIFFVYNLLTYAIENTTIKLYTTGYNHKKKDKMKIFCWASYF